MSPDTVKSMGYLRKSLKMSRRAIEKNKTDDLLSQSDYDGLVGQIDGLVGMIDKMVAGPATPMATAATAAPAATSTDGDGDGDVPSSSGLFTP